MKAFTVNLAALAAYLALSLLGACSGGSAVPPVPSELLAALGAGNSVRVYGGPGSADAGTAASATTTGGTNSATVAADGSFALDVIGTGSASVVVTVSYTKQGSALSTVATLVNPSANVNGSLFATGSAPNDIALGGDALYVANSMDNTVVKYSLDGSSLATRSFDEFAGPAFLTIDGNAVWTVSNGVNSLTGLRQSDLAPLVNAAFAFTGSEVFIGPAAPLAVATSIYVPRNQIASFGPTVYGPGVVSRCDVGTQQIENLSTFGKNPGYCAYDNARGLLYVVATGEIQFDENFAPYADSDGFLEVYDVEDGHTRIATINLGRTGPQRIALSPDGESAYLANALNGNLYKVDLASWSLVRGLHDPIVLTSEFTYTSDVQFTPDGKWLLATSFNTDELYVIDPATDKVNAGPYPEPLELDGGNALLSGAARMAIGPAASAGFSARVYVVLGIANSVASVDLF